MHTNKIMIETNIKEQIANTNEIVTRGILNEEFSTFEERLRRRMNLTFEENFSKKFKEFDDKFYEKIERIEVLLNVKFERRENRIIQNIHQLNINLSALIEDQNHKIQALAEGIMMQIEANERKWHEHLALHGLLDKRINRLESEVLIA